MSVFLAVAFWSALTAAVGLAFAVVVWLFARKELVADRTESVTTDGASGRTKERRRMQAGDWFNAAINLLIGLLLGSAVDGLVRLVATGAWLSAAIITGLFGGVFLFMLVVDKATDRLFTVGIRPASRPRVKRRTPLLRLMALPVGVLLGVVAARLGLDLIAMLP
jgi:hypothetical protein